MWEQRYGFPEPGRTASGYRVYTEDDVAAIKRVLAFRDRGPLGPGGARARSSAGRVSDRQPVAVRLVDRRGRCRSAPSVCDKPTMIALSRAIEEEAMARAAGPVVIAAFQASRQLPRHRAPLSAPRAGRGCGGRVRDFDETAHQRDDEPAEIRDRADRGARPRVGGGHRRARLRRLPVGWETPVRGPRTGSSRRCGRWTPRSCVVPRKSARRSRRGTHRSGQSACSVCSRTVRWPSSRRRPGSPRLTNRMIGYLDAS